MMNMISNLVAIFALFSIIQATFIKRKDFYTIVSLTYKRFKCSSLLNKTEKQLYADELFQYTVKPVSHNGREYQLIERFVELSVTNKDFKRFILNIDAFRASRKNLYVRPYLGESYGRIMLVNLITSFAQAPTIILLIITAFYSAYLNGNKENADLFTQVFANFFAVGVILVVVHLIRLLAHEFKLMWNTHYYFKKKFKCQVSPLSKDMIVGKRLAQLIKRKSKPSVVNFFNSFCGSLGFCLKDSNYKRKNDRKP